MDRIGTRVIHVKHLAGYILKRWKLLVLGMVVGLCLFSVYGYVSIKKTQKPQEPVEKRTEIAVTEAEFATIQGIVDYEILLEGKETYIENSILMQIDPLHKWSCSDVYTIFSLTPTTKNSQNSESNRATKDNVGVEQEIDDVPEVVDTLVGLFSEQIFWERLSNKTADKMDVGYLREIVSAVVVADNEFKVVVVHTERENARKLCDLVEQCLVEIANEESRYKNYILTNEKGESIESVDNGLIEAQKNVQVQMMGVREGLANRRNALSDGAKQYLELYKQAKEQENYKDGQPLEWVTTVTKNVLVVSKKTMTPYLIKGGIGGFLCVVILLSAMYSYCPFILNPANANELFGLRILNDKFGSMMSDEEYELIAAKIDVNVPEESKANAKVLLTGSVEADIAEESMQKLKQQMEKLGINVIQSSFLKEKSDEMKKLKQVEQVVLVEQLGTTRFENLAWEVALCEDSGKKIAGVLFV